jgi:hypothetical protein
VAALANYLGRYGYLPNEELEKAVHFKPAGEEKLADPWSYDSVLEEAVRQFQRFYGLPGDGRLNEITRKFMEQPRCGNPDITRAEGKTRYVLQGSKWPKTHLTWSLFGPNQQFPTGFTIERLEHIVREQCAEWGSYCRLRFQRYDGPSPESADIHVGFFPGVFHGSVSGQTCPSAFYTGILGHGFYPDGGPFSGQVHLNTAVTFSDNYPPSGYDLYSLVLHEVGHTLGLAHTPRSDAVMYAYYHLGRGAQADDIQGISALYGAKVEGPVEGR